MHYRMIPPVAAFALAASLLSSCGEDPAVKFPGVYGKPNPNGHGLITVDGSKTPAETPANALRQDITSVKEFAALMEKCSTLPEYEKVLGPVRIAYSGPYAGTAIYPNFFYNGYDVSSICLVCWDEKTDLRKYGNLETDAFTKSILVMKYKYVPFMGPAQAEWFKKPATNDKN